MQKRILVLIIVLCPILARAQEEDAWVYFVDKTGVTEALADPTSILSAAAMARKQRHNVVIDTRDVPVNEAYITTIKNTPGITVLAKSKWFNCVYVRGTQMAIQEVLEFPEVSRVDFADRSLNLASKREQRTVRVSKPMGKDVKWKSLPVFGYGDAMAQIEQLGAEMLHQNDFTGTGMTIAVMDSGFPNVNTMEAFERARSQGRLLEGYDFVDRTTDEFAFTGSSHGTQTFSTIAGYIEGQFVGTAPDASYYLFRTEDVASETPLEEALWVEAAERADSLGVDVINTSLGYSNVFTNPAHNYTTTDMDGDTAFISRGANIAFEKGMLLVTSAGNSGNTSWGTVTAPADSPGVLTVGAIDATGAYAGFSSRGPTADGRIKPDVVARGSAAAVISTQNTIGTSSGTSFSSPIMAGAAACLWQAFPQKTNAELMEMIRSASSQYTTPEAQLGYGIPDFGALLDGLATEVFPEARYHIYPNPVWETLTVVFPENTSTKVRLYTMDGKLVKRKQSYGEQQINMTDLRNGMYVLVLESKGNQYTQKIIRQ